MRALKRFPALNASLDEERQEIVYKRYYHIGIAVATERGLIVPVLKDADRKSVLELAREIAELSQKAREGSSLRKRFRGPPSPSPTSAPWGPP